MMSSCMTTGSSKSCTSQFEAMSSVIWAQRLAPSFWQANCRKLSYVDINKFATSPLLTSATKREAGALCQVEPMITGRTLSLGFSSAKNLVIERDRMFIIRARSVEDETRNDRRNANRNPEWWGDLSQLVEIEKLKFIGISRYKFKLKFWLNLNSSVSPSSNSNCDFSFAVDKNLLSIQDFDLHFDDHSESHLPRNGLYTVVKTPGSQVDSPESVCKGREKFVVRQPPVY